MKNMEMLTIKRLQSNDSKIGYNLTEGGEAGKLNSSVRLKISASNKMRTVTSETKLKMSIRRKGIKLSIETRARMSESRKGKNNPMFGISRIGHTLGAKHNDATKRILRDKQIKWQKKFGNPMKGRKRPDLALRNQRSIIVGGN